MDTLSIYRGTTLVETIKPDDSSSQYKKVMGENELRLAFRMAYYTNFRINDFCTAFGETYKINALPQVTKISRFLYEYNMTMQAEGFDLLKAQYLLFKACDFSLMGNTDTFIDLIISNANRISPGWIKGQVIPSSYKNLTFKTDNCYSALSIIANGFDTEFSIEGKTIHLTQRSKDTGLTLKHGKFNGLYEIVRTNVDNTNVFTRLYAYGSNKNLPTDYRGGTRLKMQFVNVPAFYNPLTNRTRPAIIDPGDYIELNTGTYGIIEATQIFEDIYPHRTGTVTSVNAANILKIIDSSLNFDINAKLMPGTAAKITFNTGQLAGYTFNISAYNNTTKEITIIPNHDETALDIPSLLIKPAIGDTYVLIDIIMPDSYVLAAEEELKNKAISALALASEPQLQYSLTPDPIWIFNKGITLNIGDMVWFIDSEMEIRRQVRIVSALRNILKDTTYTIELSDVVTKGLLSILQNDILTQNRLFAGISRSIRRLTR